MGHAQPRSKPPDRPQPRAGATERQPPPLAHVRADRRRPLLSGQDDHPLREPRRPLRRVRAVLLRRAQDPWVHLQDLGLPQAPVGRPHEQGDLRLLPPRPRRQSEVHHHLLHARSRSRLRVPERPRLQVQPPARLSQEPGRRPRRQRQLLLLCQGGRVPGRAQPHHRRWAASRPHGQLHHRSRRSTRLLRSGQGDAAAGHLERQLARRADRSELPLVARPSQHPAERCGPHHALALPAPRRRRRQQR